MKKRNIKHKKYSFDLLSRKDEASLVLNHISGNDEQRKQAVYFLFQIAHEFLTDRQKEILFRVISGEKQIEIAKDLMLNKSTVCRTYQRSVPQLKDHSKYLEHFLR